MVNQEPLVANNTNTITMSMRELDRLKVVDAPAEGLPAAGTTCVPG
ncbi:hypothetical protein [Burkholderia ubonensis]|nr:hypothetical protein [Burkholderia ubonensis]